MANGNCLRRYSSDVFHRHNCHADMSHKVLHANFHSTMKNMKITPLWKTWKLHPCENYTVRYFNHRLMSLIPSPKEGKAWEWGYRLAYIHAYIHTCIHTYMHTQPQIETLYLHKYVLIVRSDHKMPIANLPQGTNRRYFGDACECGSSTCPLNTERSSRFFNLTCSGEVQLTSNKHLQPVTYILVPRPVFKQTWEWGYLAHNCFVHYFSTAHFQL